MKGHALGLFCPFSKYLFTVVLTFRLFVSMSEAPLEDQLQDILKEYNISPEDFKIPFPLKDAVVIAKDFSDWRLTNGHLDITPDEVIAIEKNNKNDEELMRKLYVEKWIRKMEKKLIMACYSKH